MLIKILLTLLVIAFLVGCIPYRSENAGFGELRNRDAVGRVRDAGSYR
jgi:hypothetical protein